MRKFKFKKGDEVVVTRDYTDDEAMEYKCLRIHREFDKLIGRSFKILTTCADGSYLLEECDGQWFPECVLMSRAESSAPKEPTRSENCNPDDRCTITLERFGADGKKYVSGCVDITERGFEYLWDEYIEGN